MDVFQVDLLYSRFVPCASTCLGLESLAKLIGHKLAESCHRDREHGRFEDERGRDGGREGRRERQRQTDTQRHRETDRDKDSDGWGSGHRDRQTDRNRETEKDREERTSERMIFYYFY